MDKERNEVLDELLALIILQDKEIRELRDKIFQIQRYIDIYESYIKRGDF